MKHLYHATRVCNQRRALYGISNAVCNQPLVAFTFPIQEKEGEK